MQARARAGRLLAAGMAMILAGCMGGGAAEEPPTTDIPRVLSSADVGRLVLPLDPYADSLAFVDLVERATDAMVQRCMDRYGLSWPRYLPATDPTRPEHLRRWGITDADEVARYGYLPAEVIAARDDPPTPTSVDPDAHAVAAGLVTEYHGIAVPERGCFGEANRELAGERAAGTVGGVPVGRRLSNESYEHSLSDSRVKDLFGKWSACMRKAGYRYERPFDASGDPAWSELDTDSRPIAREIETATADLACRQQINLVGVWFAVESGYQAAAVELHREELEQERSRIRDMERRAREALGRAG